MFDINLTKYKNMFGEPGKGAHRYRVFNIAIVDVFATILLVYFIFSILQWFNIHINFWILLSCVFILGIFAHRAFGVRTTVDKTLFPNP
jgi:phosphoglycerol transferase MdoB-like AlkP superfamily enzyme